ncbi:MAG: extracellular solute-binding protein [Blautia sp.]|nr:extracellular solute-binding protein [Blautia sp.]
MKKRVSSILVAGTMAAVMLAGTVTVSAEGRTFKILSMWAEDDGDSGSILKNVTENYKAENPDFEYEIEVVSSDNLKQKIATLAASNDLPDVFAYDAGTPLIDLIDSGLVANVSEKLDALGVAESLDAGAVGFLKRLSLTEELYDLPLGQNIEGFWYNKELFAQAGIETPPVTWDEMLADADKLMEAGIQPFAVGGADQWPATRWLNAYVMRKGGVDFMDKAYAGEVKYTDDVLVEAAAAFQDMVNKGYFGEGATTVDYNTAANMIMAGEAAMLYNGSWYVGQLNSDTNPAGADGVGFFNIPEVEGGVGTITEYSMNCGTILAMAQDKYDEVSDGWLSYFVTHVGEYAMTEQGSFRGYAVEMPEDASAYTKLIAEELTKVTGSSTWFEAAMDSELSQIAQENVQSLMNGEMSPEQYAESLQEIYDAAH